MQWSNIFFIYAYITLRKEQINRTPKLFFDFINYRKKAIIHIYIYIYRKRGGEGSSFIEVHSAEMLYEFCKLFYINNINSNQTMFYTLCSLSLCKYEFVDPVSFLWWHSFCHLKRVMYDGWVRPSILVYRPAGLPPKHHLLMTY